MSKNDIYVTLELTKSEYIWLRSILGHSIGGHDAGDSIFEALSDSDPVLSDKCYKAINYAAGEPIDTREVEAALKKAKLL